MVCQALIELGHDLKLWVPDFGGDLSWSNLSARYGLVHRFDVQALPQRAGLGRNDFALQAVSTARSWEPDLHYVWPLQSAGLASFLGRPTLLEMHDVPSGTLGPWWFRLFLWGKGARRLLVTTAALKGKLSESFGRGQLRDLPVLAPNGVDLKAYAELPAPAQAREQFGLPEKATAVYTGHLYSGRGVDMMLALAKMNPDIQFVLAGGEPETVEKWRAVADREGAANMRLLGFVDHALIPLVQAAGDVLLMPYGERVEVSGGGDSSQVASPMKAFEYLATGRAIMCTDLPVLREVFDESSAALIPPGDVDGWNARLRELIRDDGERARLAKGSRQAAAGFSWVARARRSLDGLEV
jgi:glycosyltransferase involved in cell wall biosynthesis